MPVEYLIWVIAERFHWTLAEINSLSLADVYQFLEIEEARQKARE